MEVSTNKKTIASDQWVYASLAVIDDNRRLKPSHVGFDRLRFDEAPRLTSSKVEIILTVGDEEQRSWAIVLPHEPDATRIPIQLIGEPVCTTIKPADDVTARV